MTGNPYRDHLAERVLGADPLELVILLYEELARSIGDARRALAAANPRLRARSISRAMEIVGELAQSVNPSADPQLAARLSQLYTFLLDQLHSAHAHQLDAPLANAERVARTLLEAWQAVRSAQIHSQPCETPAVSLAG
ncbi:MAG: flagellar export chaperone FliS [Acidobacteriota bacterium]